MQNYIFIDDQEGLERMAGENTDISWMCFDTEFVGEKRYTTLICLYQVCTRHHNYLIDPLQLDDLSPLLRLIEDPSIVKITHAGENDYRLLYKQYGVLPRNIFDTQIAAGFVGYRYPLAYGKLVEGELRIRLRKGHAVTDWEKRPLGEKQLQYALDDIVHLHGLWEALSGKLQKQNRLEWVEEEFAELEKADYYRKDPHHEALNSNLMSSLNRRDRLFLLRLFQWRQELAEKRNHSKEMVLPKKYFSHIIKGMRGSKQDLKDNRRIPNGLTNKYWSDLVQLYEKEMTEEERTVLRQLDSRNEEDPKFTLLFEILYSMIKYKCLEYGVSPAIAVPRSLLRAIKEEPEIAKDTLSKGWRREIFGNAFTDWLANYDRITIDIGEKEITLGRRDHG